MKKTALLSAALLTVLTILSLTANAQSEYRIRQALPADIDSLHIISGWQVRINQGSEASLTVVTPCQAFYDDANEPEVCTISHNTLELLENHALPKSTVIEITLEAPIRHLWISEHSNVTTGRLKFASYASVDIVDSSTVQGSSWLFDRAFICIGISSDLRLDSITGSSRLRISQYGKANLECPVILSPETKIKRGHTSTGTPYQTDSTIHMVVKKRLIGNSSNFHQLILNGGIAAPIPLYMNNTSGSPYNRGENYRITLQLGLNPIPITNNISFTGQLRYEWDWSRLLNTVAINGNSLVLDNSVGAERPQQHLLGQHLGYDWTFTYRFGKTNEKTGLRPFALNLGLAAMYNISGRLATRTMGTDNHWHRTNEKVDVFNPWQLRAHLSLGGGPLTRASIGLTYDLLPTFRSGIGADNVHTFGVTVSF
ncbi:MAG: hypothetical protein J6X86_00750 [Bacteroidales bacterium]|nr:hypothetical protein [Bacteroidales bacterium]